MAIIGQTTLRRIRLTIRLLEADELIEIPQRRISIRVREQNIPPIDRIHDCSRSLLSSIRSLKKALTQSAGPYIVVMESTGVYWKSVYSALEDADITTQVVNTRHVKQVPGRKTDLKDSQWLASLARSGLLKASFVPDKALRELRLMTHYRIKL